jgi:hypothetical protein
MNKVFSLDDACMLLIRSGWSGEAYGLSRSIVECALTLRYISANREDMVQRTMKFANASKADRRLWLHFAQVGAASKSERQYIDELAAERDLFPDTKSAFKHWSGEPTFAKTVSELVHPLDPEGADTHYKGLRRASDYFYTSHFVHCSQTALDYSRVLDGDAFSFKTESADNDRFIAERCITLLISYSKQVAAYALFGMNVPVLANFTVFTDFTYDERVGRFTRCPHLASEMSD